MGEEWGREVLVLPMLEEDEEEDEEEEAEDVREVGALLVERGKGPGKPRGQPSTHTHTHTHTYTGQIHKGAEIKLKMVNFKQNRHFNNLMSHWFYSKVFEM